jgi:hypothetical protein
MMNLALNTHTNKRQREYHDKRRRIIFPIRRQQPPPQRQTHFQIARQMVAINKGAGGAPL